MAQLSIVPGQSFMMSQTLIVWNKLSGNSKLERKDVHSVQNGKNDFDIAVFHVLLKAQMFWFNPDQPH